METPGPARNITESEVITATISLPASGAKRDNSENLLSKSNKAKSDRAALVDITNDSPIVGLAAEILDTPSSAVKNSIQSNKTPGSGEALLRQQVKNLLQKIEEESVVWKLPAEARPLIRLQVKDYRSFGLPAPTPANTPHISNLSDVDEITGERVPDSKAAEFTGEVFPDSKAVQVGNVSHEKEQSLKSLENPITRALLFDSPEKSDFSDASVISSELTCQGSSKSVPVECSSDWSTQANAGSHDDDPDEDDEYLENGDEESEVCREEYENEDELDELCEAITNIRFGDEGMLCFRGRHTRFIYNDDGDIEGEEEVRPALSPSVLHLRGLPTPKGKHLRFNEEDEDP